MPDESKTNTDYVYTEFAEDKKPNFLQRMNSLKLAISFVLIGGAAVTFALLDREALVKMAEWAMGLGGTFLSIFLGARMASK